MKQIFLGLMRRTPRPEKASAKSTNLAAENNHSEEEGEDEEPSVFGLENDGSLILDNSKVLAGGEEETKGEETVFP